MKENVSTTDTFLLFYTCGRYKIKQIFLTQIQIENKVFIT